MTVCTDYIGNTFGKNGFTAGSTFAPMGAFDRPELRQPLLFRSVRVVRRDRRAPKFEELSLAGAHEYVYEFR